jgi:hypothetical protein
VIRVVERQRERIREDTRRFVECNLVPFEILVGLLRVPLVDHVPILRPGLIRLRFRSGFVQAALRAASAAAAQDRTGRRRLQADVGPHDERELLVFQCAERGYQNCLPYAGKEVEPPGGTTQAST